jgi:hypothetical protein
VANGGPCTVSGSVLEFGGGPLADAWVDLYYDDAGVIRYFDGVMTDASGAFSFESVPETSDGELWVYFADGSAYQSWGNSFTSGENNVVLRPGHLGVALSLLPGSSWTPPLRIETYGSKGGGTSWLGTLPGVATAMAPDCQYAVAYLGHNRGIEWSAPTPSPTPSPSPAAIEVVPGELGETMSFAEADARGTRILTPRWSSGKPGSSVKLALDNWPQGYVIGFAGAADAPRLERKTWSAMTASGKPTMQRSVAIPTTAPAGYAYNLYVYRKEAGSDLVLNLAFQVATLKSSKATISKGSSIRLSGVVPVEGRWGATPGKPKSVTLYKRTTSAGQPANWDATRSGWTKVGTYKSKGNGYYQSGLLKPARTTWYIARYPGDAQYDRGFTSVLKVTVK